MKFRIFVVLATILTVACANLETPAESTPLPNAILLYSFETPTQSQYFATSSHGQYSYGYKEPLSTKQEVRSADGVTRGSYSYLDAARKLQTVDYIADVGGFRVAATNLPRPVTSVVQETPEVAAARAQHLAVHEFVKLRSIGGKNQQISLKDATSNELQPEDYERLGLPVPVVDTPEVAAAKKVFFARFEEELLRHKLLRAQKVVEPVVEIEALNPLPLTISIPQRAYLPSN